LHSFGIGSGQPARILLHLLSHLSVLHYLTSLYINELIIVTVKCV
jgi:hypothetical protein